MLPAPSTSYRSKNSRPNGFNPFGHEPTSYFRVGGGSHRASSAFARSSLSWSDRLRSRARLTNLAVALILMALMLSLWANFLHLLHGSDRLALESQAASSWGHGFSWSGPSDSSSGWDTKPRLSKQQWLKSMKIRLDVGRPQDIAYSPSSSSDGDGAAEGPSVGKDLAQLAADPHRLHALAITPPSIESTIERNEIVKGFRNLVIVAGHAIWRGSDPDQRSSDDEWILTPFQRGGSVKTFFKHIEKGVEIIQNDSASLLIFSGGQTRPDTPPSTEGQSYMRLAQAAGLLPQPPEFLRATTEDFALDSFENLLFSLARFKEVTGHWPEKVTVIGFEMKRARFETLHRAALKIPADRFEYIGIDDEGDNRAAYEGEFTYGFQPFMSDPYGCLPPLSLKRLSRNPFARYHSYHTSCPEIADLLEFCPARSSAAPDQINPESTVYPHALPWEGILSGQKRPLAWGKEERRR